VVPGDVVLLAAGSLVPGDGVLLEAKDCFVNRGRADGRDLSGREETPAWRRRKGQPGRAPAAASSCGTSRAQRHGPCAWMARDRCRQPRSAQIAGTAWRRRAPMTEFERGIQPIRLRC
jgi:Mg2+-importing ATPase